MYEHDGLIYGSLINYTKLNEEGWFNEETEEIEDVNMPVDESIFDLYASEPVEEAVKAFEEIAEQEETADSER